jgi:hypothetical protein
MFTRFTLLKKLTRVLHVKGVWDGCGDIWREPDRYVRFQSPAVDLYNKNKLDILRSIDEIQRLSAKKPGFESTRTHSYGNDEGRRTLLLEL